MSNKSTTQALNNIGAICILSIPSQKFKGDDDDLLKKYKVFYTKNCISQVRRHYTKIGQAIEIHLYKYGTRTDADKIREALFMYCIKGPEKNWYQISLEDLLDQFMKHFEPDIYSSDGDE
jgi:hypothetical protein